MEASSVGEEHQNDCARNGKYGQWEYTFTMAAMHLET